MKYLDFEKPLAEIEGKAEELRAMARGNDEMDVEKEAAALDKKSRDLLKDLSMEPDALAQMPGGAPPGTPPLQGLHRGAVQRIHAACGDRNFADDHAVMGGLARFNARRWW